MADFKVYLLHQYAYNQKTVNSDRPALLQEIQKSVRTKFTCKSGHLHLFPRDSHHTVICVIICWIWPHSLKTTLDHYGSGVTNTAPSTTAHRSFCDLFMQISDILQQSAGTAVPKCINRWPHCAFEPF